MSLTPQNVNELIPTQSIEPLSEWSAEISRSIVEKHGPTMGRSFLWAQALTSAFNEGAIATDSRVTSFSAGLVKVPSDLAPQLSDKMIEGYVFGGQVVSPERLDVSVVFHTVSGAIFPIIQIGGRIELHGLPPAPSQAGSLWQATCWAKSRLAASGWSEGILTCRHGFSSPTKGVSISLRPSSFHATPTRSTLADFDSCTIDAAILGINRSDWPSGVSALSCQPATFPGQTIEFQPRSGKVSGHVLRTYQMQTYVGNLFGQRIIIDQHGAPGDSGTLLRDPKSLEGVGIYMGTIPDGSGGKEGIFQALSQVVDYFKLSLFF